MTEFLSDLRICMNYCKFFGSHLWLWKNLRWLPKKLLQLSRISSTLAGEMSLPRSIFHLTQFECRLDDAVLEKSSTCRRTRNGKVGSAPKPAESERSHFKIKSTNYFIFLLIKKRNFSYFAILGKVVGPWYQVFNRKLVFQRSVEFSR